MMLSNVNDFNSPALIQQGDAYAMFTVNDLDLPPARLAFDQGKQAYTARKYDKAVDFYTQVIENLYKNVSAVLLHRAAAYEMQGNYQLALADAQAANPDNDNAYPDPYMVKASALYLQGDQRGAALTYRQATEMVPFDDYPEQHVRSKTMYNQLMGSFYERNQRMAQILPHEILSNIMMQVSGKDRMQLAFTCRVWYEIIVKQWGSSMWRKVDITQHLMRVPRYEKLLQLIPGDAVEEVVLGPTDESTKDWLRGFSYLMQNTIATQRWDQIKSLELFGFQESTLIKVLEINSKSLEKLVLRANTKDEEDRVAEILSDALHTCPNMKSIEFSIKTPYRSTAFTKFVTATEHSQDPTLCLSKITIGCRMEHEDLLHICQKALPSTKSLVVNSELHAGALLDLLNLAISDERSVIEDFQFKKPDPIMTSTALYTTRRRSTPSSMTGLKTLVLEPIDCTEESSGDIDHQLDIAFRKFHNSLELLAVDFGTAKLEDYEAFNTLTQRGAVNLKTLIIKSKRTDQIDSSLLAQLIAASPSLQHIELYGASFINVQLGYALGGATSLKTLRLHQYHHGNQLREDPNWRVWEKENGDAGDHFRYPDIQLLEKVFAGAHSLYEFSYDDSFYKFVDNIQGTQFLLDLTQLVAHSGIRKLDLSRVRIDSRETLETIVESLSKSIRLQQIAVLVAFDVDNDGTVLDVFASIKTLSYLKIFLQDQKISDLNHNMANRLSSKWHGDRLMCTHIRSLRHYSHALVGSNKN